MLDDCRKTDRTAIPGAPAVVPGPAAAAHCHREHPPGARRWPVRGQGGGRPGGRGGVQGIRRRPRQTGGAGALAQRAAGQLGQPGPGRPGQRRLAGAFHGARSGALLLLHRSLDRSVRQLLLRAGEKAPGRGCGQPGAAGGPQPCATGRRAQRRAAARAVAGVAARAVRVAGGRAGGAVSQRVQRAPDGRGRSPALPEPEPRVPAGCGAATGPVRQLVRAVSPLDHRRSGPPRHVQRRSFAAADDSRHGL